MSAVDGMGARVRALLGRLAARLQRRRRAAALQEEISFHLDYLERDYRATGMPESEARDAARRQLGNRTHIAEASWEAWSLGQLDLFLLDLRYTLRSLRRTPALAAVVALTFAVGIGANAAIVTILERLFVLAPPGITEPALLREIYQSHVSPAVFPAPTRGAFSYGDLLNIKEALPAGVPMAGCTRAIPPIHGPNDLADVAPAFVVDDYFGLLGVHAALGRLFTPEETQAGSVAPVAVISRPLWTTRYGGDRRVIGRTMLIAGQPYTIIGVTAGAFRGIGFAPEDLWLPMGRMANTTFRLRPSVPNAGTPHPWYESSIFLRILVRVRSEAEARALALRSTAALRQGTPGDTVSEAALLTLSDAMRREAGGSAISVSTRLGGVAAILLLIACANVATLLLARALRRRRETAVRLALGASRGRLVRLVLLESLVLALVGATAGAAVGVWGAAALRAALWVNVHWGGVALGVRLVAFAVAIGTLAGIVAGVIPALAVSRPDLTTVLQGGARAGVRHRARLRGVLVAVQSALCVVLLAGAALFVRSLQNLDAVDIGYAADRVVLAHVPYGSDTPLLIMGAKLPELAAQIRRLPGVEGVALMANPLLTAFRGVPVLLPDAGAGESPKGLEAHLSLVSANYFATVGTRIVAGRSFLPSDQRGSDPVAIVDETLATAEWPGGNAVGQCIVVGQRGEPCRTIVGVAAEAHVRRIVEEPAFELYLPAAQTMPYPGSAMVIRAVPARVRAVAAETQKLFAESYGGDGSQLVQTMADVLAPELRPWRLGAALFMAAGLCALLLATVGIYGSVGYSVSERMHEMSVRAALGAPRRGIVGSVVGEGVRAVGVGVIVGVGATLALGRLVSSMLYGLTPHDPVVLVAVSIFLVAVAMAACLVPSWRAVRANPIDALRSE